MKYIACSILLAVLLLAAPNVGAQAQDITTAVQYFNLVADRYGQVNTYEGRVTIGIGKSRVMAGNISFKAPSLLRIDFTDPPDQVIDFDGETLTVYIPELHAVLEQAGADKPGAGSATLATREGLKMMKRSYSIAFESSPAPLALDDAPGETAVRLVLTRTSAAEGFTTIKLYVNPDTKLIRRMEGTTLSGDKMTFDFLAIKTNVDIPTARFTYDSPASANVYNNFLFKNSDN